MLDVSGFEPAAITREEIEAILQENYEHRILTGIKIIDDVYSGLSPSDIFLIGAATGVGKTELSCDIAMNARYQKKRVHMFALEAERKEISMRILFKKIAEIAPHPLIYKKWYFNEYKDLGEYTDRALETLNDFEGLSVFYRKKEFGVDDFIKQVMLVREKSDLIIVDHIHYFDLDGRNENKELSDAVKKIRDIALLTRLPIIMIAHIRKSSGSERIVKLVPDLSDFHGTSDLSKVCTKAMVLSSRNPIGNKVNTFFHFPKFRLFGGARNYIFMSRYDLAKNSYEDRYDMYYFKQNNESLLQSLETVKPEDRLWLG